jgi:hypothetical protein
MGTDTFTNAAALLPSHLTNRASVETPQGRRDEYTDAAAGGREGSALEAESTPDSFSSKQSAVGSGLVARFDAPPYTIASLEFGTPAGAQGAVLLCGTARNSVLALNERLSSAMGTRVAADERDALAALRTDLHVWAERLAELMRSIAKVKPSDL